MLPKEHEVVTGRTLCRYSSFLGRKTAMSESLAGTPIRGTVGFWKTWKGLESPHGDAKGGNPGGIFPTTPTVGDTWITYIDWKKLQMEVITVGVMAPGNLYLSTCVAMTPVTVLRAKGFQDNRKMRG
jgi:hypothetical protein